MIVNIGKRIRIETGRYLFHADADTPGLVTVTHAPRGEDAQVLSLPGNPEEGERFIAAYRRVLAEDLGYRIKETE